VIDRASAALAAISALLVVYYRINSAWLILGGALMGLLLQEFR
jgi:hypothetical protein